MPATPDAPPADRIRDAATVILWRRGAAGAEVLVGTRGARAAFMPRKVVFPGGAVDPGDAAVRPAALPPGPCLRRLAAAPRAPVAPTALLAAALRETREETGLVLGRAGDGAGAWRPDASALRFVFRAITPPGRPRRFDARFFLVPATAVQGDPEDLSGACGELADLHWAPLDRVRDLDLPFITEVVLGEVAPLIAGGGGPPAEGVPFVTNDDPVSAVVRLA